MRSWQAEADRVVEAIDRRAAAKNDLRYPPTENKEGNMGKFRAVGGVGFTCDCYVFVMRLRCYRHVIAMWASSERWVKLGLIYDCCGIAV